MPSERIQRQIDALLDEVANAISARDWQHALDLACDALAFDPDNADARSYEEAALRRLASEPARSPSASDGSTPSPSTGEGWGGGTPAAQAAAQPPLPSTFAAGRYHVRRYLGEGAKKRVFEAHDALLDRDVAFALIRSEGLDATGRERIVREAQAMARLGTNPNVVGIYDIGEETPAGGSESAPYIVTELMPGGDVASLLAASEERLPLTRSLEIAMGVARGLAFAHAQRIVHRDLKPGNVWLSAEGVPKIGDFGLAYAEGRSRLTLHGLLVGTVAYMPPEQALGGEVTPQSDLYSLGAMLYELVTGKPPFAGDTPTAVISQHINTPPVAPSWNSEHCPPDLEALILRLLAKVPGDRPASAAEVLAALGRVDPEAKSTSHSGSQANPLDRLARGVFVGRERELERLREAFDQALDGRGSVVMLVGEPGIGKTRTTQELETYARMRGAQVLWGRAHESAGAPPYFPWVQIARAYRAQNDDETRRREWQPYAVELQRLFPPLRDLFPNLPPLPEGESEEGQFRMFDALAGFLRDVAERVPLLVVLDDLHWSDRPTLQMLTHLAREIAHARLLVLGTYRDTDLDRTHPLSQALGELNREALFTRIALRGLAREDVAAYIRSVAQVEAAPALVTRIHEETEGNPFFLGEVVNLMAQEGTLAQASSASVSDIAIPEGVKEALGRRLDRLSPEANGLLTLAAVAGREFDHTLLVALTGQDDETVLRLVEEALAGRVIEETGTVGGYRFTHALMQETLAGELSAARQVRMHGQIAEALERLYGAEAEANAAQLAAHFADSAVLNRTHAQKAAHYSRIAGDRAAAQLGWDEAMHHYERCLAIIEEAPDRLGEDEAAICAELAQYARVAGRFSAARSSLDRALVLFEAQGRTRDAARALTRFYTGFMGAAEARAAWPALDRVIAASDVQESAELCLLLATRAGFDLSADGDAVAARGKAMAERLGLTGQDYPWRLRIRESLVRFQRGEFDAAASAIESLLTEIDALPVTPGPLLWNVANNNRTRALIAGGKIDGAIGSLQAGLARAEGTRRTLTILQQSMAMTLLSWLRGEVVDGAATSAAVPEGLSASFDLLLARIAFTRADFAEALRLLAEAEQGAEVYRPRIAARRAAVHAVTGDLVAARAALAPVIAVLHALDSLDEWVELLAEGQDALLAVADAPVLELIASRLAAYPELRCMTALVYCFGAADVSRGLIALRLDRVDEAEQHFRTGLEWASRPDVRFIIDQGRCLQGLAEVAARRGDLDTARTHLDAAGTIFAKCGAKLYLDQVLERKAGL